MFAVGLFCYDVIYFAHFTYKFGSESIVFAGLGIMIGCLILYRDSDHIIVLYSDDDDDPVRKAFGRFKKKLASLRSWRPPKVATNPT